LDYGTNHLPGNIFIYAATKQRVLMLVDIVFPGWVPFPYLAIAKVHIAKTEETNLIFYVGRDWKF
jgi:hypothetical protein